MTNYFLDSSAVSKNYMQEAGSTWVMALVAPAAGHVIVISQLAIVEVSSALARKQRLAQISQVDADQNRVDFLRDVETLYLAMALDETVLRKASDLVVRYPLRTLDAIQLACALEATNTLGESFVFVCADNNLLNAASAEGFVTDNPYLHP